MCGGGWLHARVLCGWKDRCLVSAVHGGGNGQAESALPRANRRCHGPGFFLRRNFCFPPLSFFYFYLLLKSTQLARRVQPKRTQMEVQ